MEDYENDLKQETKDSTNSTIIRNGDGVNTWSKNLHLGRFSGNGIGK